ncbi:MAG: phosphoribosylglycinamide formyltransferase [Clostridia bacterium]|jgi:phosphoribosylglycinamide formyltransferase-1|nr:phosphoribosylglycinamide formyltransferase [Clostridia bacterium]MBR0216115.1 phosphoribosylglycinamide formyltransferase [Clostridia bacterium]
MKQRIAVLVSGGGTNLQALLDREKDGAIPSGEIVLVLSNREGAYALTRAANAGKAAYTVTRKKAGSQEAFEKEITRILEDHQVDLIILAGFLAILSQDFTDRWAGRIINIHPSLIPSFCGAGFYGLHVHEAALARGVKVSGATVHYVNEIPDGGEIILQKAVDVLPGDTPETLQKRIMEEAEWILLPQAAELVCRRLQENGGKE